MEGRFERDIYCQECGEDDRIEAVWDGKFRYHYECKRCNVVVKEVDRENDLEREAGKLEEGFENEVRKPKNKGGEGDQE